MIKKRILHSLIDTVREGLHDSGIEVIFDRKAINNEAFTTTMARSLIDMMNMTDG